MLDKMLAEHEEMHGELWKHFFPLMEQAINNWGCSELNISSDGGPLKVEYVTKMNNRFYVFMFNDEFDTSYLRFLGLIKPLENEQEAFYFLKKNQSLGTKIYIDNRLLGDDNWAAVLSLEHPLIGGFPDREWFSHTLMKLDGSLSAIKEELS